MIKEEKNFDEVFMYLRDYFKKLSFVFPTVSTITKADGTRFHSVCCLHPDANEEKPIPGIALLWSEDRTDLLNEVDGIMLFDNAMKYLKKESDSSFELRPKMSLSFESMPLKEVMPLVQFLLHNEIKVEENNPIDLYNESQDLMELWK